MTTDLSDLLAQKQFEELTLAEQEMVLAQISEEDYTEQREMIIAAKMIMADEAANMQAPLVPIAASNAMRNKKAGVFAIFSHRVPTWAAVAACAILFTLFNYSGFFGSSVQNNSLAASPQIDTVYVEKLITEFRDIKQHEPENHPTRIETQPAVTGTQISNPPVTPSNTINNLAYSDEMLNAERINYTALLQNHSTSQGISLQNDSISQMVNRTVY